MKHKIQTARFDETEVTHLIADFGIQPSSEKGLEIQTFLRGQKEQFLTQERKREAQTRQRPGQSL